MIRQFTDKEVKTRRQIQDGNDSMKYHLVVVTDRTLLLIHPESNDG